MMMMIFIYLEISVMHTEMWRSAVVKKECVTVGVIKYYKGMYSSWNEVKILTGN